MTAWTAVLGPFAVVVALLVVPGLLLGAVLRLRGLLLLAAAAPLSVAAVSGGAVVAGQVGLRWSLLVPAAATAVTAGVFGLAGRWRRPADGRPAAAATAASAATAAGAAGGAGAPPREELRERLREVLGGAGASCRARLLAALAGATAGAGLVAVGLRRAVVSPQLPSQSADELFHLDAVRFILRTGDASSLHLSRLTAPGARFAFYPAAWHDLVALVVQLTGTTIPVATNLLAMACAALLWPLGVVALADRVLPRTGAGAAGVAAAGVLAGASPCFPWLALSWGVLYPSLLAYALLPAVVALVVAGVQAREPAARRRGPLARVAPGAALLALGAVVAGLGLAHPSAVAGLVVVAGPLVLAAAARGVVAGWRAPHRRRATAAALGAAVLLVVAAAAAASRVHLLAAVMAYRWPDDVGIPQATGEALLLASRSGTGAVLLAALVVVGAAAALRRRCSRWLVAAWALCALLLVVAETTPASLLTGAWYNDSNRLAVLLVLPAVVLGAAGAVVVAERAAGAAHRLRGRGARAAAAAPAVPVLLALVAALGPANGMPAARGAVHDAFPVVAAPDQIIGADELALFRRVAAEVPAGAVIADDPFQGTSVVLAYADRTPLFAHLSGRWDAADRLIASGLDRVGSDPAVCAAVRAKGVQFLLDGGRRTYDWLPAAPLFTGIDDAAPSGAFTLVDAVGDARLYRLTACAGA